MKVEVLGAERRRRWSFEEKLGIVEETMHSDVTVSAVARRHDLAPSVLFLWRRLAREGRLGGAVSADFIPVTVAPAATLNASHELSAPTESPGRCRRRPGMIEIDLGKGRRVRVDGDVDPEGLHRILRVVESLR